MAVVAADLTAVAATAAAGLPGGVAVGTTVAGGGRPSNGIKHMAVWRYARGSWAAKCHRLQHWNQCLQRGQAMAPGTRPSGGHADGSWTAECHRLFCCHQCLCEGRALAPGTMSSGGDANGSCGTQCHHLLGDQVQARRSGTACLGLWCLGRCMALPGTVVT